MVMAVKSIARGRNGITTLLAMMLFTGLLFFLFSSSSDSISAAARLRKSNAAAANPLSPPTSAFRKLSGLDGQHPPPPVVHYQLNNLTATADPISGQETILILTPLTRFYQQYWDNLLQLSYPHEYISLGYIIPKTVEGNEATARLQDAVALTQSGPEADRFQSVTIIRQDFEPPLASQDEAERHKMVNQKARRECMARARNSLLFTTLGPHTSWVLWLDSDIVETPADLIQDLASVDEPIVAPNCLQRFYDEETQSESVRPYDFNSWQDSEMAQELAGKMGRDEILLEGYAEMATYRTLMGKLADTRAEADRMKLMSLDGVGGTALLVKAEVHRNGAMFPPFPFYHLVETEGFAKMASRLGWKSFGLPNYFVSSLPLLRVI